MPTIDVKQIGQNNIIVDFEAPFFLTDEDRTNFVKDMVAFGLDVNPTVIEEPKKEYSDKEHNSNFAWSARELMVLLSGKTNEEMFEELKIINKCDKKYPTNSIVQYSPERTIDAIAMHRATFNPAFRRFLKTKGKSIHDEIDIKEFLEMN